jgi:hypothetical protein
VIVIDLAGSVRNGETTPFWRIWLYFSGQRDKIIWVHGQSTRTGSLRPADGLAVMF